MRRILFTLAIIMLISLVACSGKRDDSLKDTEEQRANEIDEKSYEDNDAALEPLSDEAIYDVVYTNYEKMEEEMQGLRDDYVLEWEGEAWIETFDLTHKRTKEAYDIVKERLQHLVADHYMEDVVHGLLVDHFAFLIKGSPFYVEKLADEFTVVDKSPSNFRVEYAVYEDETGYYSSGVYRVTFIQEDDNWVISNSEFTLLENVDNEHADSDAGITNDLVKDGVGQLETLTLHIFEAQNENDYDFLQAVLSSGSSLNEEHHIFTFENTTYPHEQEFIVVDDAKDLEHRYTHEVESGIANVGFASIDYEKEYSYVIEFEYVDEDGRWKLNDMDINK